MKTLLHLTQRHTISQLICGCLLLAVMPVRAQNDPTLRNITNLERLDAMRYDLDGDGLPTSSKVSEYNTAFGTSATADDNDGVHSGATIIGYELRTDLDFAGTKWENPSGGTFSGTHVTGGWETIADHSTSGRDSRFLAIFEGNNNTISNLFIDRASANYVGLFGYVATGAEVRNLGLVGGSVKGGGVGSGGTGGLAARNGGTIRDCYATGNAEVTRGNGHAGGLVGRNEGSIEDSYAMGNVTATKSGSNAGGLVGKNDGGTIRTSYAMGDVTAAESNSHAGGLVGLNDGNIQEDSYATGDATATKISSNAGGLVGRNESSIEDSYATGDATATKSGSNAGGLVGESYGGTITRCHATGNAEGITAGGLVGEVQATPQSSPQISMCYATGNAEGTTVGGLVGDNEGGTITACYATGNAEAAGSSSSAGGLAASNNGGTITASYATGNAEGRVAGGLAGSNIGATITACYAAGNAEAAGSGSSAGGLVGSNSNSGTITACYTIGNATATGRARGLVGKQPSDGTATASYFDSDVSNRPAGDANSKTTSALQTPTGYTGIYADWDIDEDGATTSTDADIVWDLGTASEYPALKADWDGNGTATVIEFGEQIRVAPPTTNIDPEFGAVGETVTITGTGFSSTDAENEVTFLGATDASDDRIAPISSSNATEIVVTVPSGAQTGKISVTVNNGRPGLSTVEFEVVPTIDDIDPEFGAVNDPIEIIGTGFSATAAENEASFDGGNTYVMAASIKAEIATDADTLTVNVPSNAVTGTIMVKVNDGMPATSADAFEVVPTINEIDPEFGPIGETVTITGTGFSSTDAENEVTFLGEAGTSDDVPVPTANVTANGATELVVIVPSGAMTGTISVTVGGETATSANAFEVVPAITNIVPMMAQLGATIKIAGTRFSSAFAEDSVLFSGSSEYVAASNFIAYDATNGALDPEVDTLEVAVPSDAQRQAR